MNWVETGESFDRKDSETPTRPKQAAGKKNSNKVDSSSHDGGKTDDIADLFAYIQQDSSEEMTPPTKEEIAAQKRAAEEWEKEMKKWKEEQKKWKKEQEKWEKEQKTYNVIALTDFGWVNCDRYPEFPDGSIELKVIAKGNFPQPAKFYVVFTNMRSIIAQDFSEDPNDIRFHTYPRGQNARLVGMAVEGDDIWFGEQTVNGESETVTAKLKKTTFQKFKQQLAYLN